MCHLEKIEDGQKRLSSGPWRYLRDKDAHYVLSGSGITLAVFAKEQDARSVVEILLELPGLVEVCENTYSEKEYDALAEERNEFEDDIEKVESELVDANDKIDKQDALIRSSHVFLEGFTGTQKSGSVKQMEHAFSLLDGINEALK